MVRLLSVTFTLFLSLPVLWAGPVGKDVAMVKARQFYGSRGQASKAGKLRQVARAVGVSTAMENDCFYVFTAGEGDGFVIISGDDRTEPVLGYSDSGTFKADAMPSNMKAWLEGYADQIRTLQKQRDDDPTADSGHGWGMPAKLPTHAAVAPLLTSKWDQDEPYNLKCPVFFDESKYGRAVTGCVATAMAQIINYHKYPASTTQKIPGYTCARDWKEYLKETSSKRITVPAVAVTKLDWSNMLDKYDGSETATQKNAVATLMLACGASVQMDYGISDVGGSSAYSQNLKNAFITYFDYDKSMKLVERTDYTATEWDQLIYAEMAASRPVCFAGQSTGGGHEFVVDGYDGSGYYHLNWGWGGMHDGYYLLGILTPADDSGIGAGQGGYNAFQEVLIGIRPNTGGDHPANPVMTTDSINIVDKKSYTRTSTSSNFTGVTVGASFWNRNGYTATFDYGYGIYDASGNLKSVHTLRTNATHQNTYGLRCYKCTMALSFGSSWANGKYRIVPISKPSSGSQWLPCSGSNNIYILAVVNGNTLELSYPSEKMDVDLTLTNTPEAGGPADLKITIANNGADYIGQVLLYTPDIEDGKYIYEELVEIKAGETQTRVASVKFSEAGTYTVMLALDDYNVLAATSVTVTAAQAHALTCTYNVTNGNSSTRTIDGNSMNLDITYTNTGSNTYDNEVYVWLFKKVAEDSYDFVSQKTDRLTLAKGAKATRSYVFSDLEDGGVYWARMYYVSAGETKYYGNTNLYTVHNTSTPVVKEAYAVVDGSTLSFYYDEKKSGRSGKKYAMNSGDNYPGWAVDSLSITKAGFDASFAAFKPTTTAHWFEHQVNLTAIQGLSYLNTSSVTNMQSMFYECYALPSVDVSSFDTRNVVDMRWMFYGCSALKSLNVKNFNTSKVTSMKSMFNKCSSLTTLDLSSFDTQNVTDMGWMFYKCWSLASVNISKFNTANVTAFNYMFFECTALTQFSVSSFNTAKATLMNNMFTDCGKVTSLDLSNFNTANVTDMNRMFYGCTALTQVNVSSFNTAKVTNMRAMFYDNENLTSLDLSNFRTSLVTDMAFMFRGCSKLKELDLSGFTTPSVTEMRVMFWGCSSLTTIYVKSSWDTSNATSSDIMFGDCNSLVGGMGTRYDANYTDKTYARIDGGTASPGYFTKSATSGKEAYAVLSNGTLTFYYDASRSSRSGKSYDLEDTYTYDSHPAWQPDSLSIGTVAFNSSFANYRPTSTAHWFTGYYRNLTTFTGMENLKTDDVTNMDNMFSLCRSLRTLDVSHFNTSKVTNMHCMFYGCSSLQTLEVGGFDTRNVTNFQAMFYNCSSLIALDVERFNTEKAFYLNFMFYGCSKINLLDVSNFNTKYAIRMEAMFDNCSSVKSLDLRNFNTSKLADLSYLFYGCTSLVEVNLSSFDTANATTLRSMFYNCSSLTTIYASRSWDTSKVTDSQFMFSKCVNIVGGAGTMFNSNYTDKTYARLDAAGTPGYFTYKAAGQRGDVNDDGHVDVADIATIIQVMGRGTYDSRADVNGDKVVDVADIATVISIMATNARRQQALEEVLEKAGMSEPVAAPAPHAGASADYDANVVTDPVTALPPM